MCFKLLPVLTLVLALFACQRQTSLGQTSDKDGTLIVRVMWGDEYNTPAKVVYIEARGFVRQIDSSKSFLLKNTSAGQYEASLPPGYYDVFVSEDSSTPRCRRVMIHGGSPTYWTLKLEIDDVYLPHMR